MPSKQWVRLVGALVLLFGSWLPIIAASQAEPGGDKQAPKTHTDFQTLSDQRNQLDAELREDQRRVDKLTNELTEIQAANESLAYYKGLHTKAAEDEVRQWSQRLSTLRTGEIVGADLGAATKRVAEKQAELASVESQIKSALDIEKPRQEFKKELSIAFSILLGAVIAGFYWIVGRHHSVRSSIFAGDAGLQFITLFALIIAIILFGLTEILQGRELAALLGGISGYILGRSAGTKDAITSVNSGRAKTKDAEGEVAAGGADQEVDAGSVVDPQQQK
jgi:hypothetical protein